MMTRHHPARGLDMKSASTRTGEYGPQIAKRLQQAMEEAGLSVATLSERSLVTQQTIYRILDGHGGNSSIALIADLAKALQLGPAWLGYGVEDR